MSAVCRPPRYSLSGFDGLCHRVASRLYRCVADQLLAAEARTQAAVSLRLRKFQSDTYNPRMAVIKIFVALLLLTTLPLQGYAAVAMPFCQHSAAKNAQASDTQHKDHSAAHSGSQAADPGCDDCAYCQACASPVLPTIQRESTTTRDPAYHGRGVAHFLGFTPEQPYRPPLAA
jgi:hypothetical protein